MSMKTAQTVSATPLVRDLAAIRSMTAHSPVGVTSHGRTELIVLNALGYAELNANDRSSTGNSVEAKLSIVLDTFDPSSRSKIEAATDWGNSRASLLEVGYVRRGVEIGVGRLSLAPYFSRDGRPRDAFMLADTVPA